MTKPTKPKSKKPKLGRPFKGDHPRSEALFVRVTKATIAQINELARKRDASQADVVMEAVENESRK